MRKALIGILMAATVATPLAAQDNGGRPDRNNGQQRQQRAQPRQQAQPQRGQQAPARVQPQARGNWNGGARFQPQGHAVDPRGAYQGNRGYAPQQYGRGSYQGNRGYQGNPGYGNRQAFRGNRGAVGWDRSWRNNGRYDWQRYRYANRGAFHLGPYYAPYRGYYYRPLGIGFVLDSLFYNRNYWIDPAYYDLPPAPPGAEWVRYYNDVVLVDVYSGQVIDVIHDFFW